MTQIKYKVHANFRRFFHILIAVLFFSSCEPADYIITESESRIVVEGWIEEGDVAHVLVTHSIPVTEPIDSTNIIRFANRSALVIVSDGTIHDTLRLRHISRHLPPFLYMGEKVVGKTGVTYTLTVKYLNQTLTAETYIPPSVRIENAYYRRNEPADTVGHLIVEFNNPPDQQNYFQISTQLEGHDAIFVPALYGNLNSKNLASPLVSIQVTRGVTIFPRTNIESHFNDGDVIRVRLRTMPKKSFDFWNSWQNGIVNAQNAIFPANASLKSNINGGIGIWSGYGQSVVRITAR